MKKRVMTLLVLALVAGVLTLGGSPGELVVTSIADSGPGSLREALQQARSGDAITFDPAVFPSSAPGTIHLMNALPPISHGNLTIDGSNVGVILDGSNIPGDCTHGLEINSSGNIIQGLQVVNFTGVGILLCCGAGKNTIGGDRSVGLGPLGRGNLVSGNNGGIGLWDEGTSVNTITGNLIGTGPTETEAVGYQGNIDGIFVADGASDNVIGPDNIIACNHENGIVIRGSNSVGNTITQNSIYDNAWGGIHLLEGGNMGLLPPIITDFDLADGTVAGTACANCTVEIFSDSGSQGEVYEGQTTADATGSFAFDNDASFTKLNLTATATDVDGNTSGFSAPTLTPQGLGETLVVTSIADSGPGTLRQALLQARSGDIITFDSGVFMPGAPATIYLENALPPVTQGNLTINSSNAGVILDGSRIPGNWAPGLEITSDDNTIQGLQLINFASMGIFIHAGAQHNTIGGDRRVGSGPLGQGNLTSRNQAGIFLGDEGTSFNTITGNIIGTGVTGKEDWGNLEEGVILWDGPSQNIVGPDNIIAYNGGYGLLVAHPNSFGNTITQNSVHDNARAGIFLDNGNSNLPPPFIYGFDLVAGTVTGSACANCSIEIFSDGSDQGKVYEGQTKTDDTGVFSFNKGAPFTSPHLTATATDADSNTSGFSAPTTGASGIILVQEGNNLPRTLLQHRESVELEDNRIGEMYGLYLDPQFFNEDPGNFVKRINNMGLKWMNVSLDVFDWNEVEDQRFSRHHIDPAQDEAITGLVEHGIKVMYTLVFWDEAILEKMEQGNFTRFKTEEEIQRYLDYVRFIVHNFKDRVEYYQILNEPCVGGPGQFVESADYINLVKRTVPIIRQEYPEAKIVIGSTPIHESGARKWFFDLLESDVMPLVNAISWHPASGFSPQYHRDYYYSYATLVEDIKDVASRHGFQGEYIIDGLVWRTPRNPHPLGAEPWIFSDKVAAKYIARGIITHLGMNAAPGLANDPGPPQMNVYQNLCTLMAGAKPISVPVVIQGQATNIRNYGFTLPNGDHLIALWTDGIAVEDDPGVEATVIFPSFAAQRVIGIDILRDFEQQLVMSNEDGKLVIRNLLVKDYPILLRLTGVERTTPSQLRVLDASEYRLIYDADGTLLRLENVTEPRNATGVVVTVKATINGQEKTISDMVDIVDGKSTKDIRLGSLFDDITVQEIKIEY